MNSSSGSTPRMERESGGSCAEVPVVDWPEAAVGVLALEFPFGCDVEE
jgi:hypothetical protein